MNLGNLGRAFTLTLASLVFVLFQNCGDVRFKGPGTIGVITGGNTNEGGAPQLDDHDDTGSTPPAPTPPPSAAPPTVTTTTTTDTSTDNTHDYSYEDDEDDSTDTPPNKWDKSDDKKDDEHKYSDDDTHDKKNEDTKKNEEAPTVGSHEKKHDEDSESVTTEGLCYIDSKHGKSQRVGQGESMAYLGTYEKVPLDLCMSANACENLINAYLNLTGGKIGGTVGSPSTELKQYSHLKISGVCQGNKNVVHISDAQIQAEIAKLIAK